MLLYRAINDTDLEYLNDNKPLGSTLAYTYLSETKVGFINKIRYLKIYTLRCFKDSREYALDCVVGHVSGQKLKCKKSPWISATTSFSFAASEYSVPQSGNYNTNDKRKHVIVIDIPNEKIYRDKESIKKLRDTTESNFAIDLRNGNLEELFESEAILPEYANPKLPGFDSSKSNKGKKVTGFSNFASVASEVLIFGELSKKYIKAVLSPKLVDILYSCDIDISNNYDFIVDNYKELNKHLEDANNEFIGTDLVNLLISKIDILPGNNIEEKYDFIKRIKRRFIIEDTKYINKKYDKSLIVTRLVDDEILVKEYDNIDVYTSIDDLVAFSKNGNIYRFDHSKKGYYCEDLDELITRSSLKTMVKQKQKVK